MSIVVKCPKCGRLVPTRPATMSESADILNNKIKSSIDETSLSRKINKKNNFLSGVAGIGDAIGNAAANVGAFVGSKIGAVFACEAIECPCGFTGHTDLIAETDYSGEYIRQCVSEFNNLSDYTLRFKKALDLLRFRDNPSVRDKERKQVIEVMDLIGKDMAKIDPVFRKFVIIPTTLSTSPQKVFQLIHHNIPDSIAFEAGLTSIPEENTLYVQHPLSHNRYLPFKGFDVSIAKEQCSQLILLCQSLGAKKIKILFKIDHNSSSETNSFMSQVLGGSYNSLATNSQYKNEIHSGKGESLDAVVGYEQEFGIPNRLPQIPKTPLPWYDSPVCSDWRIKALQRIEGNGNLLRDKFTLHLELSSYVNNSEKTIVSEDLKYMVSSATYSAEYSSNAISKNLVSNNMEIDVEYWPVEEIKAHSI